MPETVTNVQSIGDFKAGTSRRKPYAYTAVNGVTWNDQGFRVVEFVVMLRVEATGKSPLVDAILLVEEFLAAVKAEVSNHIPILNNYTLVLGPEKSAETGYDISLSVVVP